MGTGPKCPELTQTDRMCPSLSGPVGWNVPLLGAWHISLTLVAMLSHSALSQACISVYIAVYRVYVFIPGQVCSAALA